ncbi:MAG: ABC transporter transmembrane domain-containing protein, partial [Candidatus Dormiibacterota bacterium]
MITDIGVAQLLPTASGRQVVGAVRRLMAKERPATALLLLLQGLATLAGLVGPWAVGVIVQAATERHVARVLGPVLVVFLASVVVRTVLTWWAGRRGGLLGARVLTRLREQFLGDVLELPLGVVERAGTGDLITRATSDVDRAPRGTSVRPGPSG